MKHITQLAAAFALLLILPSILPAQGTAFTYQGRLNNGVNPANGNYDLRFAIYDATSAGTQQGSGLTNIATVVSNGLFTITLDFGNQFPGANRWLEIGVRTNGSGVFTTLTPRQALTPAPYAIHAADAAIAATAGNLSGSLPASQLTGTVPLAQLPLGVVTNGSSGVNLSGVFSGNGAGITNVGVSNLVRDYSPVVQWAFGQNLAPAGLSNIVAVADGDFHSLAVKNDGTVVAWGYNAYGQTNVPPGLNNVVAVAGGLYHSVALKNNGTVVAWGDNTYGQTDVPPGLGNVAAIASGAFHNLALKTDGTVVAWGDNSAGQTNVPSGLGNVVAVAGGYAHSLAVKADGTVVAWGDNTSGQTNVPPGLGGVVAVAGGYAHSLAVKADGTVVAWGDNTSGQTNVPPGLSGVVAVAGGSSHSVALKSDGTVVVWGDNTYGQQTVPVGLGFVTRITAGFYDTLVLQQATAAPQLAALNQNNAFMGNVAVAGLIYGNGANVTNLNAANLTGTVADARLSANVALRAGGNALTGTQTVTGGSVGIGTGNPQASLHVFSDNNPTVMRIQSSGTPGFGRLEFVSNPQDDVNEWRPAFIQSLDAGGFTGGLGFYVNGTGAGNKLATNEVMRIVNGRVGIGTTGPDALLSVNGTADKPGGGSWSTFSDARLKDVGADFKHGLADLEKIQPVHYHYKTDNALHLPSTPDYIGVVAQQVQSAIPEAVDQSQTGYLTVNNDPVIWTMVNAIKELNLKMEHKDARLEQQSTANAALKKQNDLLAEQLNKLEATVKSLAEKK